MPGDNFPTQRKLHVSEHQTDEQEEDARVRRMTITVTKYEFGTYCKIVYPSNFYIIVPAD